LKTIILNNERGESMIDQGIINHVAFVLDRSGSMQGKEKQVVAVTDGLIKHLAKMSQELGQETRVSVYFFDHRVDCVVFDKDVLRLPSIADHYRVDGRTALLDATYKSIGDLERTAVMYGDHSFLIYVLTDGQENNSQTSPKSLSTVISQLGAQWTLACLVPDAIGKTYANNYGFPVGNIAIWDINSATGVEEVGAEIKASADNYMVMRSTGQTGTRTLFSTDAKAVNAATIAQAGLKPLANDAYDIVPVPRPRRDRDQGVDNKDGHRVWEISDFVNRAGLNFVAGKVFYLLDKQEIITGDKKLAILEIATHKVFVGDGVRAMIGLADKNKRVAPDFNADYKIFVQSKSTNRHLHSGAKVLVLK
jgi:hypothetical protein